MNREPGTPERDPRLSAAWDAHSTEVPASRLDTGILAAAHRAVKSAPLNPNKSGEAAMRLRRWRIPLAAAATFCAVSLGILLTTPQKQIITAVSVSDKAGPVAAPQGELGSALRDEPALTANGKVATALPAQRRAREEKKQELSESYDSKLRADEEQGIAAAPAARVATAAAAGVDIDAWIDRIRKLRELGKMSDAAKELIALRAAIPDADQQLPADLQSWAATVKP